MPNRFIKSVVSVVIMTALLFGGISACFADNESAYDSELSGRGFPQIVINSMTVDGKEELCANDQLKFAGASISTLEEKSANGFSITVDRDGKLGGDTLLLYSALVSVPNQLALGIRYIPMLSNAVVSKGIILSGDLMFSIITTAYKSGNQLRYLNLQENYIWRNPPSWRLSDQIEFAWTPGQFAANSSSVTTRDRHGWTAINGTVHLSKFETFHALPDLSRGGAAVFAELPGHQTLADQIWGDTSFNLYPSSNLPSGSEKISASYTHQADDFYKVLHIFQYLIGTKSNLSSFMEAANSKVTSCVEAKW